MADLSFFGMDAIDRVEKVYRNQAVQLNSKALKGQSVIGDTGSSGETAEKSKLSFKECLDDAVRKETEVFQEGKDVVMSRPPAYRTGYQVDMDKTREEMTMDEYKRYICNRVSSLPVSNSMRIRGSGVLIFKEEAFESMKNNLDYENEIIERLREEFSKEEFSQGELAQKGFSQEEISSWLLNYKPDVEYEVIGKTSEECYGASIPVKNGWLQGLSGLGMTSGILSNMALQTSGLSGLFASDMVGLGLTSSGLLSGVGLTSGTLSSLALQSGGLSGLGLSSSGFAALGRPAAGEASGGRSSVRGAYGINKANVAGAYRNTVENHRNNYKNTRAEERRWRV